MGKVVKKIQVNRLSIKELQKAVKQVKRYRTYLENRVPEFLRRLADVGIQVAENNMGEYKGTVVFSRKVKGRKVCHLLATPSLIKRQWVTKSGVKTAEVNPLLMAEFGSGWFAVTGIHENEPNVGQGTFPNQKHAFDPKGWTWTDEYGGTHHSFGEEPTYPMFLAVNEMIEQIDMIAKEVFG